jgi:hypothetical protein
MRVRVRSRPFWIAAEEISDDRSRRSHGEVTAQQDGLGFLARLSLSRNDGDLNPSESRGAC